MVFCVRYAIRTLVCLKSFVTNRVSFPTYVNVTNLCGVCCCIMLCDISCTDLGVRGVECFSFTVVCNCEGILLSIEGRYLFAHRI